MSAHTAEYIDLCAGHALRSLDDRNQRRLLEHVSDGCEECERALDGFEAAALIVARGAPVTAPAAALRARVLSDAMLAVGSRGTSSRELARARPGRGGGGISTATTSWTGWLFMFLSLVCAALAALMYTEVRRLRDTNTDLQKQVAIIAPQMVDAQKWQGPLTGTDSRLIPLTPVAAGAGALRADVFLDPVSRRAILAGGGFPSPGSERYVAWAVVAGRTTAVGGFLPDARGRGLLRIGSVGDPDGLTRIFVTREPTGGALPASPSGTTLATGDLRH